VLRRSSRLTVDGLRPSSAAVARTVLPRLCSWAMTARSSADRNLGDSTTTGLLIHGGYSRTEPAAVGTLRPNRHRVPVRRLTPTVRQASVLLIPCAISLANDARCCESGSTPGQPVPAITTSRRDARCDGRWNPPRHPGPTQVDSHPFCLLWVENGKHMFCKSHHTRWTQLGRPGFEDYLARCLLRGKAPDRFPGAQRLKLEFQYAVQSRHDAQKTMTRPTVATWALRLARAAGVSSLLDHDESRWRELAAHKNNKWLLSGFLRDAYQAVESRRDGTGWAVGTHATSGACTPLPG